MGRRRRKIGRPTKLDALLTERLLALVRNGVPAAVAAGAVGITEVTFYQWMRRGAQKGPKKDNAIYRHFLSQVKEAKHACHAVLAAKVYEAGKVDGKLGLAILSKRFARHWADRDSLELRGSESKPLRVSIRINPAVMEPESGGEGSADAEPD